MRLPRKVRKLNFVSHRIRWALMVPRTSRNRFLPWAECAGFVAAILLLVCTEISRHPEYIERPSSILSYTPDLHSTWLGLAVLARPWTERELGWLVWATWAGIALLAAIPLWWLGKPRAVTAAPDNVSRNQRSPAWQSARWIGVFVLSLFATSFVGKSFEGLPPAYHDEYSYIFQAKTFLLGRLYVPADGKTQFFSQMHVLNDNGVFASRYFPGVGLWLAPAQALGHPYWSQCLAGAAVVALVFWIGCELPRVDCVDSLETESGRQSGGIDVTAGLVAAVACALSPALLLFGNLLLSHHPTMLGLMGFTLCYFRALRSESMVWPIVGGLALCFAMLCRPLTAFGFAFPFGVHTALLVWRGELPRCVPRLTAAITPLIIGVAGLATYNVALTGNPFESPYGLYTKIYTPSHRYGFHNVSRAREQMGPRVLQNYDRWAEELTLPRAVRLLAQRADACASWSLGRITLAWFAGVAAIVIWCLPTQWRLLVAAIVGVHAVYFPFGFEGIFDLSYVFETVPLLCLLVAGIAMWLVRSWRRQGRYGRIAWLGVLLIVNLSDPLMHLSRGISEVRFPRQYYAGFEQRLQAAAVQPPALIMIRPDPKDRHRDLVVNSPSLDDPILRARLEDPSQVPEIMALFPDRHCWLYDAESDTLAAVKTK